MSRARPVAYYSTRPLVACYRVTFTLYRIHKGSRDVWISLLGPVLLQVLRVLTLVTGVTKIAYELLIKAENSFNEDERGHSS
jgi:hypothetical protein